MSAWALARAAEAGNAQPLANLADLLEERGDREAATALRNGEGARPSS